MIHLEQIIESINQKVVLQGNTNQDPIRQINDIKNADITSLIWIKDSVKSPNLIIEDTSARIIICHTDVELEERLMHEKCLIKVSNPKLALNSVLKHHFSRKHEFTIHPSAEIHNEARIDGDVTIGAYSYVGKCEIEANSVIESNVTILDQVKIGKNVRIQSGVRIGSDGGGYIKRGDQYERIVHIGGVNIGNNVEIGANSTIDRGTLGNTIIEEGTKIGNLVQVAHNARIGENCLIISSCVIAGSATIGDNTWIGPKVIISNGIKVGKRAEIGLGSIVTADIPANARYVLNKLLNEHQAESESTEIKENEVSTRVGEIFKTTFPFAENYSDESSPENTPGWDSLGNLNFIVAIEEEYSIELPQKFNTGQVTLKDYITFLEKQY